MCVDKSYTRVQFPSLDAVLPRFSSSPVSYCCRTAETSKSKRCPVHYNRHFSTGASSYWSTAHGISDDAEFAAEHGNAYHSSMSLPAQPGNHSLLPQEYSPHRRSSSPRPGVKSHSGIQDVHRRRNSDLSLLQKIFVQSNSSEKSRSGVRTHHRHPPSLSTPESRTSLPHEDLPSHGRLSECRTRACEDHFILALQIFIYRLIFAWSI